MSDIDISTPAGCLIAADEAEERGDANRATELRQIAELMGHPERCTLYVKRPFTNTLLIGGRKVVQSRGWQIATWPGTVVSTGPVSVGLPYRSGFGRGWRFPVRCFIFGQWYVGTHCESGDYVNLRRAKCGTNAILRRMR